MNKKFTIIFTICLLTTTTLLVQTRADQDTFLIDDFTKKNGVSSFGTK